MDKTNPPRQFQTTITFSLLKGWFAQFYKDFEIIKKIHFLTLSL